ncbi:MAG TPA: hypothetical protein VF719_10915, partial [Abditibacteriaceae bacterium]
MTSVSPFAEQFDGWLRDSAGQEPASRDLPDAWRENEVVIYGAGNFGREVRRLVEKRGARVRCFLDANARDGQLVDGLPCHAPDAPEAIHELAHCTILVAIFNYAVDTESIEADLRRLGYHKVQRFFYIFQVLHAELGERFWLGSREVYVAEREAILAASDLWTDDESRKLYSELIQMRLTGASLQCAVDRENQYFPRDLPPLREKLRFIDCGAFDGDTLRYLVENENPVESVAAFEPDGENFG